MVNRRSCATTYVATSDLSQREREILQPLTFLISKPEAVRLESRTMTQIRDWNSISLRPATSEDQKFLREVFKSSRGEDLRGLGWDEDRIGEFLDMQFDAQKRLGQDDYRQADDQIVLSAGQPAGRLTVERRAPEIPWGEVAVLPAYREARIGTVLIPPMQ